MLCKKLIVFVLVFSFTASSAPETALAFESSSGSFEIHAGDIESITGSSTSSSFKNQTAGGQSATGTSTAASESIFSGILYWMLGIFVPSYEQIHYRWRNDDNTEALATWAFAQDTTYTSFPKTTIKRLRFEISNEGWTRGSAPQFKLQVAQTATCSSGTYTDVPTTATTEHWEMADSSNIPTDDALTTDVAGITDENNIFVGGRIKDLDNNPTTAITLNSNNFTAIEYSIRATTNAVASTNYCLRLLDSNLTPTRMAYTQYARAVIAGYAAEGSVISSTFDTGLVDGAAYNSLVWQGTKPANTLVRFQFGTSNTDGSWSYYGPACTTASTDVYSANPDTPIEIGCASTHNNKRYYKYKVQLCSSVDCTSSGSNTPQVDDVIVNWSP